MPSTWRRCPSCSSKRFTQSSVNPSLRALASDCTLNSASNEYSCRSAPTTLIISVDEIRRNAAIDLLELALRLEGEARPEREHLALLVRDHAVDVVRRIDQIDRLEIAVAEAQGARQRKRDRIDARDFGALRHDLRIAALAHHPDVLAGRELLGHERRGAHRRCADRSADRRRPRARLCSGWMNSTLPGTSTRAVEGDAHIAHRERHGVAIDHHEAALGVDDHARCRDSSSRSRPTPSRACRR